MVEKIIINPTKVRAYGNIIGTKTSTNYDTYNADVTGITDTVNGEVVPVMEVEYDGTPPVVHNYSLALDSESYTTTGSLSVSATLLDDGVAVSGATVSFTGGVSTVTATTNSSGVATATVNFTSSGTLTASYSNVSDTASVTVSQNLLLSTNKSILSYYDSESATLTATYTSGATMELYNASTNTKIGNFTDNNDGTYTYTYSANGTGDIYLKAKVGSTESTSILIEDCLFYGINTSAFTIPSNTTFTSDGSKITVTTSTSSEKQIYFNHTFNQSDDFLYEVEVAQIGTRQSVAVVWNNGDFWGGQDNNVNYATAVFGNDYGRVDHTFAVGDKFKIVKENGTSSAYINDTVFKTSSATYNSTFKVGFYTNSGRTQYVKNIKIKSLE